LSFFRPAALASGKATITLNVSFADMVPYYTRKPLVDANEKGG
jgi:hypothetical protein